MIAAIFIFRYTQSSVALCISLNKQAKLEQKASLNLNSMSNIGWHGCIRSKALHVLACIPKSLFVLLVQLLHPLLILLQCA